MVNQRILYKNDKGGVSVIVPSAGGMKAAGNDIHRLARKDVPKGKKYLVVPLSEVSPDRTFRNAWEVNEADLVDGVGAESNEF